MGVLPDRIETKRLTLRSFREEDVERFVPLIGEWDVARWLARVPHPYSLEDGRWWVVFTAENRAKRATLDLLAVRREDGQPVGGIGLNLEDGEVGYWLGLPYQGIGYGTEMVRAMLRVAFDGLQLPRLWAAIAPDNDHSRRVLEKTGFTTTAPDRYELTADRWRIIPQESAR